MDKTNFYIKTCTLKQKFKFNMYLNFKKEGCDFEVIFFGPLDLRVLF